MLSVLAKPGIEIAKKMLVLQFLVAIFCTLMAWLFISDVDAISALLGGVTVILPNLLFITYAFRYAGARQIQLVYKSFQRGSKLKLALTIVLFLLIFRWPNVQAMPLFGTFVLTMLSQWIVTIKSRDY